MAKKILIIGAGYAGIEAAITLNKTKKREDVEITLIDKNDYHTLLTELHEAAGNRVSEDAVRIPLNRILRYTDVKVVCDSIEAFDLDHNKAISNKAEYNYDYLIMAMGSRPEFFGIPGLKEHGFELWSFEDAVRIREHVRRCFVLAASEKDEAERRKLLTFTVGGASFTGVEMIGELAHWVKKLAAEYYINRKEIRLAIIDMLPAVLNGLHEKNAAKAHKYMVKKLGVEVILNTRIQEITEDGISTSSGFIPSKTLIWAAGVRSACDIVDKKLEQSNFCGRLKVDEFCRTRYPNVYAVGDISALLDESSQPFPAMVENAIQTAHGAAINIMNSIKGKPQEKVKVKMHGTMVSIGNFFAVSEIMGRMLPVWLSVLMKFFVNIHYLWEITGFRGVARYLYHEVLERQQKKLLLEKHWSTRMQAWWLTPLRVFLGAIWLYEGIAKITQGWLESPKLAAFLGMAADASSSASAKAAYITRIDDVFKFNTGILNFFIGKESRLVDGNTISDVLFSKLDILHIGSFNLVPWFLQHIVLANDTIAMIFQVAVVILEICVGLMLIGGVLSFAVSVISFGLMIMFFTSTGIYEKSWWMIFASIAVMGGAGRAFGLDYYILPYLNNVWEYFWKNRKFRLFFKDCLKRSE